MIGGVTLTLRELERLSGKRSPLVRHKGLDRTRPNDLKSRALAAPIRAGLMMPSELQPPSDC